MAKKLHVSDQVVNNQLTATARSDVSAVDVTAISTDPAQAVAMANAAATALNSYVLAEAQTQFNSERDAVLKQLNDLKGQQADLEAQLAKPGADTAIINAQLDSVVNQYRLVYEQFQTPGHPGRAHHGHVHAADGHAGADQQPGLRLPPEPEPERPGSGQRQHAGGPHLQRDRPERGAAGVQEAAGAHRRAPPGWSWAWPPPS